MRNICIGNSKLHYERSGFRPYQNFIEWEQSWDFQGADNQARRMSEEEKIEWINPRSIFRPSTNHQPTVSKYHMLLSPFSICHERTLVPWTAPLASALSWPLPETEVTLSEYWMRESWFWFLVTDGHWVCERRRLTYRHHTCLAFWSAWMSSGLLGQWATWTGTKWLCSSLLLLLANGTPFVAGLLAPQNIPAAVR